MFSVYWIVMSLGKKKSRSWKGWMDWHRH